MPVTDREDRVAATKSDVAERKRRERLQRARAKARRAQRRRESHEARDATGATYDPDRERDAPTPRTALGARDTPGKDARDARRAEEREQGRLGLDERRVRTIDKLVAQSISGRRDAPEIARAFERLTLTSREKEYAHKSSVRQGEVAERKRVHGLVEAPAALFGFGELAKVYPGGTPAKDISPGWAAVEAASILPVGRAVGAGARGAAKGARAAAPVASRAIPTATKRGVRTLRAGEKVQQLPAARSRVTKTLIERPADAVSRALMGEGRTARAARKVLRTASAEARVAKAAGREQVAEASRVTASMSQYTRKLPKEGSPEDVAHFWWAQLPKSHRNAQGLKLVRERQAAELADLTSGRALEGIQRRLGAVRASLAQADEAGRFDLLQELEELRVLASDIPNRVDDLSRSIAQLERVIAKPPKLDEQVVGAVRALSGDRRTVLEGAGVLNPERATAREGLVADWLGVPRSGDEAFIGHRMGKPRGSQPSLLPVSVGTGRVRLPEGVARENKLVLAKSGRVRASTRVAAEDWQAAQTYRQATRARSDLAQIGERFSGRVPEDHVLVNPKGRALPAQWKTDRLPHIPEGDEEAVRAAAEDIVRSFLAEGDDVAGMLDEAKKAGVSWDELRVVPKSVVKRYYGQFLPARTATKGGRAYDAAVDFTAASIVFARIGYIPKNVAQNLIMSVPHQGPFLLVNAPRAGQALADPELRALLRAEVGFSGATQGLSREFTGMAGLGRKARGAPSKIAGVVGSIGDDPLRISAFLHEAAAEGVIAKLNPVLTATDKAKLKSLLTDEAARPLLNDIRSRSVEAMADFSRLTPTQRKWARRFLIIPGWLYAGSRYPFHFAATHPGRSAAIGYAAAGAPGAERAGVPDVPPVTEAFAENLPWYMEGIGGDEGKVLRTTSLSPVSTPWEIGGALAGRSPRAAADYANPLAVAAYNIAGRRASFPGGTYQTSLGESARRNLERLAPNVTLARDLVTGSGSERYPEDASRLGRLKREVGVFPIEVERERGGAEGAQAAVREERDAVLPALRGKVDDDDAKYIRRAYTIAERVAVLRAKAARETDAGEAYYRRVLADEAKFFGRLGVFDKEDVTFLVELAKTGTYEEIRSKRSSLVATAYDSAYLQATRYAREQAEYTP